MSIDIFSPFLNRIIYLFSVELEKFFIKSGYKSTFSKFLEKIEIIMSYLYPSNGQNLKHMRINEKLVLIPAGRVNCFTYTAEQFCAIW